MTKRIRGNVGAQRVELTMTDSKNERAETAVRLIAAMLSNPTNNACSLEKIVNDGITITDLLIKKLHQ